jgi:uncharacterized protein (TIGR02145 family)
MTGWHLPSEPEFSSLIATTGGSSYAGARLKSSSGWQKKDDNSNGNGDDVYLFTALPAGFKDYRNGMYYLEGIETHFWSSTERDGYGYQMQLTRSMSAYADYTFKNYGYSVRCVQDN